jgi:hypothetical protein
MMRTMGDALRAIMAGVDKVVWCYAGEYFGYTWNRVPRKEYVRFPEGNGFAPSDIRNNLREKRQHDADFKGPKSQTLHQKIVSSREIDFEDVSLDGKRISDEAENPNQIYPVSHENRARGEGLFRERLDRFRRFGVLCFCYRQPKSNRPKLLAARVRGIFLGYSSFSNSYLVGYYQPNSKGGFNWAVLTSESVRFTDYLVRDVQELRPDSPCVTVSVDELNQLDSGHETLRMDLEPEDDVFFTLEYGKSMTSFTLSEDYLRYLEGSTEECEGESLNKTPLPVGKREKFARNEQIFMLSGVRDNDDQFGGGYP